MSNIIDIYVMHFCRSGTSIGNVTSTVEKVQIRPKACTILDAYEYLFASLVCVSLFNSVLMPNFNPKLFYILCNL
jgi:hypothetical protein